jgi:hypothetical protein
VSRFWVPGLGRYLLRHPRDVLSVARSAWRLRRNRWWRQYPWLPVPAEQYWRFRMVTVNGPDGHLDPVDVVAVAKWSDAQRVGR